MVGDLGPFRSGPAIRVLRHCLFARARVYGYGGSSQSTTITAYAVGCGVVRNVATCDKEGR
eukprot:6163032-Pleurochrysis_carterae.AAC.1